MRGACRVKFEDPWIAVHINHVIRIRLDQMVLTTGQSAELCNRTRRIYNLDLQPMQSKKALLYCHIECQVLQALESTDTQARPCYFVHNICSLLKEKPVGKS